MKKLTMVIFTIILSGCGVAGSQSPNPPSINTPGNNNPTNGTITCGQNPDCAFVCRQAFPQCADPTSSQTCMDDQTSLNNCLRGLNHG
jgi:hypothetical protein